ncbi:MAG: hypothetical protein KGZ72_10285 [Roseovarius sp.]|nr:hypothetical protein [Roseovarius sp.]
MKDIWDSSGFAGGAWEFLLVIYHRSVCPFSSTASGPVHDPGQLLAAATPGTPVVLELGCGDRKRVEGAIGVDHRETRAADVVGDVFDILAALPTGSVSAVHANHFIEHVAIEQLLAELERVIPRGGKVYASVPHFSSPYFYSDPTHSTFFGLYTLSYLIAGVPFRRRVPRYRTPLAFELQEISLELRSERPFYGRHLLKRAISRLVNLRRGFQEFYEENLVWILPCYEIQFVLERIDGPSSA